MNKILIKKKYEYLLKLHQHLVDNWKDIMLNSNQQISICIIKAKLCIYEGLLNNNKEQYDIGITKFIEYSSESIELSNDVEVKIVDMCFNDTIYENSEGKRQLSLILKRQYDVYISLGKEIF
jgi:formyltetrahydrofolate hydrolase